MVVAYNNASTIASTVRRAQSLPNCTTVVVVDNGLDDSGPIAERAGARVVLRPDNPGFGVAQNRGVDATAEPFVLLLNPDAETFDDGIREGLAVIDGDDRVGAVQGIITSRHDGRPERSMGPDLRWVHLMGRALALRSLLSTAPGRWLARALGVGDTVDRVPPAPTHVETLAATALLVRRDAFDDVGGFDESFFLYGEDLDLCRRLRSAEWELVGLPIPWATHCDGSTAASSFDRELTWWNGTLGYAAKWWETRHWTLALGASGLMAARLMLRRWSSRHVVIDQLIIQPRRRRRARPLNS